MNNTVKYSRLSKDNAACLLVDHRSGLISLVQDFSAGEFKNNILALADVAKFFELPTILTTSFEDGPNGPIVHRSGIEGGVSRFTPYCSIRANQRVGQRGFRESD